MYRFEKQRVEYLAETLLKEKNETQGGALSPIAYTEDGNVSSICGTSGFLCI
jgi:hypothetical protein